MSKLPLNWASTKFMDLFDIQGGTQPPKISFQYKPSPGYIQLLQIRDFGDRSVPTYVQDTDTLKKCTEQDILIARYGASIGKILTGFSGAYNVAMAKVDIPEGIYKKYVYYLLQSEIFQSPLYLLSRSAQSGFNKQDLAKIELPIAPFEEQKRIADKLDILFAEVGSCRELLDRTLSSLSQLRQSVLYSATAGELTKEWRNEHVSLSDNHNDETATGFNFLDAENFANFRFPACWEVAQLGSIATIGSGITKDSKKQDPTDKELPYLRVANVQRGFLDLRQIKTIRVPHRKVKELLLQPGDILFNEGGDIDKLGRGWVWNGEIENCTFQNHVFRVRLKNQTFEPKFFSWYGNSRASNYFLSVGKQTTNLASINKAVLSALPVVIPSPEEQQEIVHRVESLLADIDRMEELCQNVYNKIKQLIADLLDKAFRGELVRQNPDNESASILLARILSEQMDQLPNPRIALTKRKTNMKNLTAKSVKEVIWQLPNDMFSFEELHKEIPSHYDSLKDIIFELLSEPNPSITQFFNDSAKTMSFIRGNS